MNQAEMLARFAREGDFDCFLVAGRYTLLDQAALPELLPICEQKNIAIIIGGVYNSGILANLDNLERATFNYQPAEQRWLEKAREIKAVCDRHNVPIQAAALQFPLAHPAVAVVLTGARSTEELDQNLAFMRHPIPSDLWAELKSTGLLPAEAPTPVGVGPCPARLLSLPARCRLPVSRSRRDDRRSSPARPHRRPPAFLAPADALALPLDDRRAGGPAPPVRPRRPPPACSRSRQIDWTVLVQTRSSLDETRDFLAIADTDRLRGRRGRLGRSDLAQRRIGSSLT